MFLILFINLVFGITDNCTDDYCNASIKVGGIEKFGAKKKLKTELLTWINARKDIATEWGAPDTYTIELTNADDDKAADDAYKTAQKVRSICDHILNLIVAYNLTNSFTTTQINQMKLDFAAAKAYLQDYQPWAAKAEIIGITPDETIVTTAFKNKLLNAFSESGLPGL